MKKLDLKISIVIPAYNEESHIGYCLNAISKLEVKPYEVILVNNMSTDKTVEIARQYPFITIVNETKRGLVYARDRGFNYASGDIIGRIDADTLLTPGWTKTIEEIFADDEVQAVSGGLHFYDIGFPRLIDGVDAYWRAWMADRMSPSNKVFLFGSNMAIRNSAWNNVKDKLCRQSGMHEDLDLAIHMSTSQQKVVYESRLKANVSARRIDCGLIEVTKYAFQSPMTYFKHQAKEHKYMYPVIAIVLFNYLFLRVVFRAFDSQAQKLDLRLFFFRSSEPRANPTELI